MSLGGLLRRGEYERDNHMKKTQKRTRKSKKFGFKLVATPRDFTKMSPSELIQFAKTLLAIVENAKKKRCGGIGKGIEQ